MTMMMRLKRHAHHSCTDTHWLLLCVAHPLIEFGSILPIASVFPYATVPESKEIASSIVPWYSRPDPISHPETQSWLAYQVTPILPYSRQKTVSSRGVRPWKRKLFPHQPLTPPGKTPLFRTLLVISSVLTLQRASLEPSPLFIHFHHVQARPQQANRGSF